MNNIKTINIPVYESTDGRQFTGEEEAVLHQVELDMKEPISRYVNELEYKDKHKAIVASHILIWEQAKAMRDMQNTPQPQEAS